MLSVSVLGAGRMGRELLRLIAESADLELGALWVRRSAGARPETFDLPPGAIVSDDLDRVLAAADVAVDFSLPEATFQVLDCALRRAAPLVCGVSGLDDGQWDKLRSAAENIPLLYDRNMSVGVAVLKDLVSRTAPRLGGAYTAEILEIHHVHKKDAPSGTAIALGEALAASRGQSLAEVMQYEPDGRGRRSAASDIVFSVRREGEIAGEHSVIFRSGTECLELKHTVTDRRVFATGALAAARWLQRQKPGLYAMSDFLTNNSA